MALKILILNQPLCNRGDESAHKALVRSLLRDVPGAEIEVLFIDRDPLDVALFQTIPTESGNGPSTAPEGTSGKLTYTNIKAGKWFYKFFTGCCKRGLMALAVLHPQVRMILSKMKNADRIICAPGGIELGGFKNWLHLSTMAYALEQNPNVAYFGRSIGPFDDDVFSSRAIEVLKKMSFVSLRDSRSQQTASDYGIQATATLDSAFLERPEGDVELPEGKYAVVVPNSLVWHSAFKGVKSANVDDFYVKIISSLHSKFPLLSIVLLPQLCGSQDDEEYFKRLTRDLDYVRVVSDSTDSDNQQKIIRGAEFLVGARYHSIVFSINNDTPFVALNYEHKIDGLLVSLGLQGRGVPFGSADVDNASVCDILSILDEPCPSKRELAAKTASEGYQKLLQWICR